jgi:hypothetical protein
MLKRQIPTLKELKGIKDANFKKRQ